MKCFVCNRAETRPGTTSILLERGHLSLTIEHVPARLCPECGEGYVVQAVAAALLRQAGKLARAGTKVAVCEFILAEDR